MLNLKKEMEGIEEMIERFKSTTIIGESRDKLDVHFSGVTNALGAIAADLGQERVELVVEGDLGVHYAMAIDG